MSTWPLCGGGDGTLNAAAPALVDTGLPLGVLPLGTANDFARTLSIPPDPVKAAEIIANGVTARHRSRRGERPSVLQRRLDRLFSAELAGELTEHAKKRWGTLGYAIVAARILLRSRLFTAQVDHDGTTEEIRTMQVSVGNGRHYGGGMTVEETATAERWQARSLRWRSITGGGCCACCPACATARRASGTTCGPSRRPR